MKASWNWTGLAVNVLALVAGWCFGHEKGVGIAALILLVLHFLPAFFE